MQRRLGAALDPVIKMLFRPDTREKAIPIAQYLDCEFSANIRKSEQSLRAATSADPRLMDELGSSVDTLFKRMRGLQRLAEPVRRALADLADPGCDAKPFSLIHNGLELIEQLKRHHAWIDENILPTIVRRYREITAQLGADIEAKMLAEQSVLDDAVDADLPTELDPFAQPDAKTRLLLAGLQARYSIRRPEVFLDLKSQHTAVRQKA